MLSVNLKQIWEQLRAKKPQLSYFLEEIRISNFRGIKDLRIPFGYPVCVLAGANASGKTSVLSVCACAYSHPDNHQFNFKPSYLLPNLKTRDRSLCDNFVNTSFEYYYLHKNKKESMRLSKGSAWNKSYMGKIKASQPDRVVYLRTLANLANPSEIKNYLKIGRAKFDSHEIPSDSIAFALRILPFKYKDVKLILSNNRELLFANILQDDSAESAFGYSEFQMSAGERSVIRLSKDISMLENALVLIDEIETGLHPYTQQLLMLELQRLALRNNLQIIITTHSPAVLECVPPEGKIFLERTEKNVVLREPYKDIMQKALYGQALEKLSILCEDSIAQSILLGVMDYLNPKYNFSPNDFIIGHDTGASEFSQHIKTLGMFSQLSNFIFVLDGDARRYEAEIRKAADKFPIVVNPLFLPGKKSPESWIWGILGKYPESYSESLGQTPEQITKTIRQIDIIFASATDKPANISKNKLNELAVHLLRTPHELARIAGRTESYLRRGEMNNFLISLEDEINRWRNRK